MFRSFSAMRCYTVRDQKILLVLPSQMIAIFFSYFAKSTY